MGNSNILFGLFAGEKFISKYRMETTKGRTADEYGTWLLIIFDYVDIDANYITGAVVSCVVPSVDMVLTSMCRRFFNCDPIHVVPGVKTGVKINYGRAGDLGPDRLANIVALSEYYKSSTMVVDFGTTTSFDVINADGEYVGGVLSPGVSLALSSLSSAAPQLPEVGVERPKGMIGKNIVHSMQAGCYFGAIDMITGLINRLWNEIDVKNGTCIATGGFARNMVEELEQFDALDPHLTLKGLKLIYDRNQK
ncbi:MAG: type III pantothenate kinase [Alphaproteobacteria bacterium]